MTALEKAKKDHWEDWLEDVDASNVWTAHKYAGAPPTDGGITRIPTLKCQVNGQTVEVDTNEEKSKMLYEIFFPHSLNRANADASCQYPEPVCEFTPITDEQIL